LFQRDRYREISGFACRDHNLWINPALHANSIESELLNRSPRNIIAVLIVLEMLKLLALPLAAIHGNGLLFYFWIDSVFCWANVAKATAITNPARASSKRIFIISYGV
jgi:hypothetical protein